MLYEYQVEAYDIEGGMLTYHLDQFPSGMIISETGLISWIPTEGVLTSDIIEVRVSEIDTDELLSTIESFIITVTPVNDSPIITSTAPTEIGREHV